MVGWKMDFLLAGANYLTKHLHNVSKDGEGSSGSHSGRSFDDNPEISSLIQQMHDKTSPVNRFSRRDGSVEGFKNNGSGNNVGEGSCGETSGRVNVVPSEGYSGTQVERHQDGNILPPSVFPPLLRNYENSEYMADIPENHTFEVGASYSSKRTRNSIKGKRLRMQFIKPRSSLDSCVMAQMYRENAELEEYVLSPLTSPCTQTLRPFLVTDGRRVISRASDEFRDEPCKETYLKSNEEVAGVPQLPRIGATGYFKQKVRRSKNHMEKSSDSSALVQSNAKEGSVSGQVLFCLGISMGIMLTVIANKLETEKLKECLKQSENLVQDLQEELEMKDSLTVKELVNDDDSQGTHENSCGNRELNLISTQVDADLLIKRAAEEPSSLKEVESMSKIEAELEAELERLELSMTGSTLRRTLSNAVEFEQEFDEDLLADLVHGELRADNVQHKSSSTSPADRVASSASTPASAKYGVSPRELSLRLHEVVQSRLQEQVVELEVELAKSRKRVQDLESERINLWRPISNSETSSTLGSPLDVEPHSPTAQPLVMDLSGDALVAYHEAYEELNYRKGSKYEATQLQVDIQHDNHVATHQAMYDRNRNQDQTMAWLSMAGEEPLRNGGTRVLSKEDSLNRYGENEDQDEDDDLLLIKQIVEKARQGSPAILRARRAMVFLDKD